MEHVTGKRRGLKLQVTGATSMGLAGERITKCICRGLDLKRFGGWFVRYKGMEANFTLATNWVKD